MVQPDLQELCERGQEELMAMRYIEAERTLVEAERLAMELPTTSTLWLDFICASTGSPGAGAAANVAAKVSFASI